MFKKNIMMDTVNHEPCTINQTMNQTIDKTMNSTVNRTKIHNPWANPWTISQGLTLLTIRSSYSSYHSKSETNTTIKKSSLNIAGAGY